MAKAAISKKNPVPAGLKIRRILCSAPNARNQLLSLRDQIRSDGEVVSPRARKLTQAVFGSALTPGQVVERVCNDVRQKGLRAALHYTEQFDKVKLDANSIRVTAEELKAAHEAIDPELLDVIRRVRMNIIAFQSGLLSKDALLSVSGSHELQVRFRPMKRIGICIPGGQAAYPSSLLMTVCPAQVAGVPEIAVVMPPTSSGAYNPDMLAVCYELGVREVYRLGGAQAVASLAYGVDGLPPVDLIVGPGNTFVALAKKFVFGQVGIDCIAGPSEVVVAADGSAQPDHVAIDLLAQAEHSPGVAVLVTWHEPLLEEVTASLAKLLPTLPRGEAAGECLERFGALVLASSADEAAKVINDLAPEHLHVQTRDPENFAERIDHAGAIFLGPYTPVALGDYAAGPSHVLPTGGTARFASGLTANDFLRRTSILSFTRHGLREVADDVLFLAEKEGLGAHARSVSMRISEGNHAAARPPRKGDKNKK
jgi:histidinol dehydrogenase